MTSSLPPQSTDPKAEGAPSRKPGMPARSARTLAIVAGVLLAVLTLLVDIFFAGEAPWVLYAREPGRLVIVAPGILGCLYVWRLARSESSAPERGRERVQERAIGPLVKSARRSERSARAVMENVLDGIVVLTGEGVIQDVNPALERMFGYSKYELIGQDLKLLVPKHGEPDSAISTFRRTVTNDIMGVEWQMEGRHKDGTAIPLELSFNAVDVDDQKVFIYVMRDISARKEEEEKRKRIHEELSAARDHALAASRAKSVFLASVSHELRTPLNAILGYSEMLIEDLPERMPSEIAADLQKIHNAGRHLLQVINTILDLSKIEAGRYELEERPLHIETILANVASMVEGRAHAKGLEVLSESDAMPSGLQGDATRLQQALLNYANNAVKFTPHGRITLRSRLVDADAAGARVRFEVADTGIGIAPEVQGRLFTSFVQADSTTTRRFGGTGLGLAVTKGLAELMGGEAGLESVPGAGSTFWFTARLRRSAAAEETASASDGDADGAADLRALRERHEGARILLAEDNDINREVAGALLEGSGLVVDMASDGAEAVDMAAKTRYRLILMDMQMPRMDGLEATREILSRQPDGPVVIAMTANAYADDQARCLAAGMRDFVAKPVEPEQMYRTLLRWLDATAGGEPLNRSPGPPSR